jgi:hypothetical protein
MYPVGSGTAIWWVYAGSLTQTIGATPGTAGAAQATTEAWMPLGNYNWYLTTDGGVPIAGPVAFQVT